MAGSFPTGVTAYTNPGPTSQTTDELAGRDHGELHADVNDDLEQVMTKLGTGASTPSAGTVLRGTGAGASAYGQVAAADIADNTITATQLAADSVGASELADNAVVNANVDAAAALALSKLAPGSSGVLKSNGTAISAGNQILAADIGAGEIGNTQINSAANIAVSKLAHVGTGNVLKSDGAANVAGKIVSADIQDATIVDADIAVAAAIAKSKLNLADAIVNGDINSAASIAVSKLAHVGSGMVLKSNGTANAPGQVAAADITVGAVPQLIETTGVLGSSVGAYVTATLPTGYKHLLIRGQVKSTYASANQDTVAIRFNGDATGNYYHQFIQAAGASVVGAEALAATSGVAALVGTAFVHTTAAGAFTLEIPNYGGSGLVKQWMGQSIGYHGPTTGLQVVRTLGGTWVGAPITTVTLFTLFGSIAASSIISVYGMN